MRSLSATFKRLEGTDPFGAGNGLGRCGEFVQVIEFVESERQTFGESALEWQAD